MYTRDIKPFEYKNGEYEKQYKNGFAIMANCCLLIETLESFKNGWKDTKGKSKKAFTKFFERETDFKSFRSIKFYKHVRCGILHQGEVTGGFKIIRECELLKDKTINSVEFLNKIKGSLENYKEQLEYKEWDSQLWGNFREKMNAVIKNC